MKENNKILIVYSETDDLPIEGDTKGWIGNFHKFLTLLLSQINKEDPDVQLVKTSELSTSDLKNCLSSVVVIGQSFVGEQNVINSLHDWAQDLAKEGNLVIDGVPRFFKVLKSSFDTDSIFPELKDVMDYDFFYIDSTTGEKKEFTRFFGTEAEKSFWMKLVDIAYDLTHLLVTGTDAKKTSSKKVSRDRTVYLASTGMDLLIQRDVIKRELKRHGYDVIPNQSLPKELEPLEKMIRDELASCRLSIHMVGEDYGYRPPGSDLSVVDIQNRIAHDHTSQMSEYNLKNNNEKPFSRLIWLSPDLKNVSERQRLFIEDLKSEAALFDEAEVLQIPLQELIAIIRDELVTGGRFHIHRERKIAEQSKKDNGKSVYLIADKSDLKDSEKLKDFLKKQGFEVLAPSYEGDIVDIRSIHQDNLRRCDGSIIYYGQATPDWIKTKLQDILKAPGFGRESPIKAKAVYLQGKKDIDTSHFDKNRTLVLGNTDTFESKSLAPFITELNN